MIVSNIGVVQRFFLALHHQRRTIYRHHSGGAERGSHSMSSFDYMDRVQKAMASQFPEMRTFFSSGSMVDAILNTGMPAPIDVQVSSREPGARLRHRRRTWRRAIRKLPGVGEVYIPQDMNYPAIRLDVDRVHAGELGLSQKDVVDNVITALNSNTMIAPNYWVDHKTGNDYFLTVQYSEHGKPAIHNLVDLKQIPLRDPSAARMLRPNESPGSHRVGMRG